MSVVSLKAALKVSGLAWPGHDNVLARRSWDHKVEKILAELRVPAGKKHMVKAITKMVEEATDFAHRLRDEPEDHFGFVEMFGAHSRLGVALARASPAVVQVFENLFFAVVMARHRYLEDCFEYDKVCCHCKVELNQFLTPCVDRNPSKSSSSLPWPRPLTCSMGP